MNVEKFAIEKKLTNLVLNISYLNQQFSSKKVENKI